ncbi:MAG: hypothetical protein A2Y86_00475 [Candidatus Aminicenantes bacterium RBG_13_62_12]|nr:MAG: hypothetical protein A2Y86_00475 [Candidatus Aminicenantes bacterium RBG_13_62_12]
MQVDAPHDDAAGLGEPIAFRTSFRFAATSWPATSALPEVGWSRVERTLMVVVFPAPLGPRRPKSSPSGTENDTRSTAVTSLKVLVRFSTRMASTWISSESPMIPDFSGPRFPAPACRYLKMTKIPVLV